MKVLLQLQRRRCDIAPASRQLGPLEGGPTMGPSSFAGVYLEGESRDWKRAQGDR